MKAKYSTEAWRVDFGECVKIKSVSGTIATVSHIYTTKHAVGRRTPSEVRANANLLAAAPEMLSLLEKTKTVLFNQGLWNETDFECLEELDRVIAKAKGESNANG